MSAYGNVDPKWIADRLKDVRIDDPYLQQFANMLAAVSAYIKGIYTLDVIPESIGSGDYATFNTAKGNLLTALRSAETELNNIFDLV